MVRWVETDGQGLAAAAAGVFIGIIIQPAMLAICAESMILCYHGGMTSHQK